MEKTLCANPHGLPMGEKYLAVNGKMIYHPKYVEQTDASDGHTWCKLCRDIEANSDECYDTADMYETDYAAEDEALAYERLEGLYTGINY